VPRLQNELDATAAETAFSGVVRVDTAAGIEEAYGPAHGGYELANEVDTRFATASGAKGLTALTVVSLIEALRCPRLVPQLARSRRPRHSYRDLEHLRRSLADRAVPLRPIRADD
jgi:hypothetical protein